ncbi:MAG: ImmA/IrrE family metallo-endopeptidase [Pirellulales bacterium]
MNRREELARLSARAAADLRIARGYRRDVPVCPLHAATESGVLVWLAPIPSLEGMYCKDRGPSIIVSTERPLPRQAFTAGHELGHHVFQHGTRADEYLEMPPATKGFDPEEFLADTFSSHFLMPPAAVRAGFNARGIAIANSQPVDIYAVATWLGVGYETLITHLEMTLRLIPTSHADKLRRSSPKVIREELLGRNLVPYLVIAGTFWSGRAIDLRVGDGVLVPPDSVQEGERVTLQSSAVGERLAVAIRRGLGRIESPSTGWSSFVRVMPKYFEGQSTFRFDEDPDENLGTDNDL